MERSIELKNNSDIYKTLFENSNYAKLLVNSDGIIIKSNDSFLSMFGYEELDILNKSISILIPKMYRENHGKHLESYVKSPSNRSMGLGRKIEAQKKDNTVFPVEISLNYIKNDPEIIIAVTISDVIYSNIKKDLAEKERVFDLATEAANIGVWSGIRDVKKSKGELLESFDWLINKQINVQFGYPLGYSLRLGDFMNVLHPDDFQMVISAIEEAVNNNKIYDVIYRIIKPNGDLRYIESKGTVKFDEHNVAQRMDGVTIDVTERIESQKIIKNSANKLEKFFEMAPNGITKNDIEGNFISVNKEFERFTGYSKEELKQLPYWDLTPKKYEKEEVLEKESILNKGFYGPYEKEYISKNGIKVPVLLNGVTIKDDYDGKDYIWSIVVDMTDSVKIQKDLLEYERFFSLNKDMMAILSQEGKFLKLNPKIIELLGFSREYLRSILFIELFHPDDVKGAEIAFSGMYSGNVIENFKARLICENGDVKWVMFSALKVEETGNLFTVAKDITEIEKTQREIDLLNNELKEREHKYRQLFEKSADSILLVKDGLFVDCNQATIDMFECDTKEYFIGSDPSKVSTEYQINGKGSFPEAKRMMQLAIDNGTHRFEWLHKKKSGVIFPTEVVLTLVSKGFIHAVLRDISERVSKGKELKESRKLLIDSQHLANMGSWKWDLSSNDVTWSDELYIIFGLEKDRFKPSYLGDFDLIHDDDKDNVRKIISNAVNEKTMFHYEERIVRPSGEIRYIKSWGNVIMDEKGIVSSLYGVCLDVTSEKLQKEKHTKVLKEQLRRNKRLISTTLDGYVLTKENGDIVEVNKSYSEFIGYTEKELLKLNLNCLEATMTPIALDERNKEIKETERAKYETKYVCKNGELKYVEVSLALVKIKGESTMVAQFIRDITERKVYELRKTVYNNISQKLNTKISVFEFCTFIELELKKIMSITSFYIMLFDKNHLSSIFINDIFIKNHENVNRKNGQGLCEYVIENKKALRLNKNEYEAILKKEGVKQYRTAKPYWMGAPMISEDNSIGIITVDTYDENQIYTDADLALLEFIGIQLGRLISRKENSYKLRLLNTTLEERVELRTYELSKAKDKLAESLKKEKELSTLKSRFVSTASHQFRTPLTVIQTNIGILEIQKNKMDDAYRVIFDKISLRVRNQINKMTSMMDELLTIGKINENGINYSPKFIDIDKLCQKIILSYNDIQTDGRILNLNINGNTEEIFLDPILMEHVLSALISNAFKYSQNKPNPILTLTFSEKELIVSIKDFGIGIPEQDIEHIHEPFFRASNAIDISGTGLGTSIVKEYVEINKGELKIISKLNEQTEFILVFKK